ncbi:MAG TPA: hypothetical protein VKM94_06170 [Blastocatellia bacterium]|nr:hypothetical protein [Blastocatellia bacterium]
MFAQLFDRVDADPGAKKDIDHSGLIGEWVNTNPQTTGIARMEMNELEGELRLRVLAIGPDGLIDWGMAKVEMFASTPSSHDGAGFSCSFDFGFAETRLQGMIMKGLLVLAIFNVFEDDSRRMDYFVREYFALEHGRY